MFKNIILFLFILNPLLTFASDSELQLPLIINVYTEVENMSGTIPTDTSSSAVNKILDAEMSKIVDNPNFNNKAPDKDNIIFDEKPSSDEVIQFKYNP